MPAQRFVALLRGVNVGRGKRIAMTDLRELLIGRGYGEVKTYLQSGNAVFNSEPDADAAELATTIEQALARQLGLDTTVIVRNAAELTAVVAANPLREIASDPARYLVGFLAADPEPDGLRALEALDVAPDVVRALGRELYLWCPAGVLASPFSKIAWQKQLGVAVTTRNWNTVTQLAALANG
jgi:uncharacterized protein (DUF1697 family)